MSRQLVPLCDVSPAQNRDGDVGPYAKTLIPGIGYVLADGGVLDFSGSTLDQPAAGVGAITGKVFPNNTFEKDCCSCTKG